MRSRTPARCQSRRRRQHVIPDPHPSSCGSICQGMPLRRTKRRPVRQARSETRGRPPFGRRGGVGKNGSTRSHNGSGSSAAAIPRSRYFAGEDQVSEVLLRALRPTSSVLTVAARFPCSFPCSRRCARALAQRLNVPAIFREWHPDAWLNKTATVSVGDGLRSWHSRATFRANRQAANHFAGWACRTGTCGRVGSS